MQQLTATVRDQLGQPIDTVPVTWSTSADAIIAVSGDGLLTAVANGTATITASAQTASANIIATVRQAPASMTVTPDPLELPGPGSAALLSPTVLDAGGSEIASPQLSYSSADPSIATVSDAGAVTGVAEGGTTVTVSASGGTGPIQVDVDVTVTAPTPGSVVGVVRDATTSLAVAGATVALTGAASLNTTTDASGEYSFAGLGGGTYSLTVSQAGFADATSTGVEVSDGIGDIVRVDFALTPDGSTKRFGGVSGRVTFDGAPLPGAPVSISGGAQTNGIFQSTTTDANGNYSLVGINLDDTMGDPITQFTVLTTYGFSAASATPALVQNRTIPNVNLDLEASTGQNLFFSDGFEDAATGWTTTGFWNRSSLTGVSNDAYPTYVDLAPGDASNGALPSPASGQYAIWYGDPATGNFLGTQIAGDAAGSGGTSETPNQGELRSPSFTIPSGAPAATLRFSTWFEIESVNPNASGFDVMNVAVLPAGQSTPTVLARLNPFVDPTLPDRDAIPFTSGGFNLPPVWRTEFIDLSAYIGQSIQLVFEFTTVDALYNGFRGWLIDDVSVTDLSVGSTLPPPPSPQAAPPARSF